MGIVYARRAASPALSVVIPSIPTYDHGPTVACLRDQTLEHPYEVLVVDDAGIDRSTARNRGLRAATASVVALTDDDTRPPADWLARIHRAFEADPTLVCLEGPVYGGCRSRRPGHYVGCNLAVRRDAARSVGGFRPEFARWREDTEFGWRMERDAPGRCRFDEGLRMCHPTAPRTAFDPALERRLMDEYPVRYAEVLDRSRWDRWRRRAWAAGIAVPAQRGWNRLRRLVRGDPCRDPPR